MQLKLTSEYDNTFMSGYIYALPAIVRISSGLIGRFLGSSSTFIFTLLLYGIALYEILRKHKKVGTIGKFEILFFIFYLIAITSTYAFFPQNASYLSGSLSTWYFSVIFYFAGKSLSTIDTEYLWKASCAGVLLCIISYYAFKQETIKDMSYAYSVLPYLVLCIDGAFGKKNKQKILYWICTALGFLLLFLLSTRGPILFALLFLAYRYTVNTRNIGRKIAVIVLLLAVVYFIQSGLYLVVLEKIYDFFLGRGIDNIMLRDALRQNTASMEGRAQYASVIWKELAANPFAMHGLCGDRIPLNGKYVHNIFLELMYAFGVIGGIVVILLLAASIFYVVRRHPNKHFVVAILCGYVARLVVSGSFVSETMFYYFLGILCSMHMDIQRLEQAHR